MKEGWGPNPKGAGFAPLFIWWRDIPGKLWVALGISLLAHMIGLTMPIMTAPGFSENFHSSRLDVQLGARPPSPMPSKPVQPLEPPAPVPGEVHTPPTDRGIPFPTHYFSASEVDSRAEPIEVLPLVYPEGPYMRRVPGKVKLRVFINELGAIDAVDVLEADPPQTFEQAALDALLNTRFKPARLLGQPVKSVKTLEIRFDPFQDR